MDTMAGSQKDSDDSAATPQDETLEEVRADRAADHCYPVRTLKNPVVVLTYQLIIIVLFFSLSSVCVMRG